MNRKIDYLLESSKIILLCGIMVCCFKMLHFVKIIVEERISKVTEIHHIANIDHFYGDLPTGEIKNGTNRSKIQSRKK